MKQRYWIVILISTLILCSSCRDNYENTAKKNDKILFATSMNNWEQQNMDTDLGDSLSNFSYQTVAIKDHNDMSLIATSGEGMLPCKTLNIGGESNDSDKRTRAVLVNDIPTGASDRFMMTSYYGENNENVYFSHERAKYSNTANNVKYWIMENEQYWQLISRKLTFYAWWPCDDDNVVNFNDETKTITYNVPTDVTTQKDLLYATTQPAYYYEDTKGELDFKHALTAIRFVVKNGIAGNLTNIQMRYVAASGTFNVTNEQWTTNYDNVKTFSINLNRSLTAGSDVVLNPNEYTFLMIPQDVTRNSIQIVFTMGSGAAATEYFATLSAVKSSSGTTNALMWERGKTITYTLTKGEGEGYVIYATSTDADYTGATKATISVTSYKLANNNTSRVNWKVTGYSTDLGETWNNIGASVWTGNGVANVTPWITGTYTATSDATNGRTAKTVEITTTKAAITESQGKGEEINTYLKSHSFGSASSYYDLSMRNGRGETLTKRETANCYLVRGYGYFCFPAVYGNAIKNGEANTSAYNYSDFQNYKGNKPTNPWIPTDTGETPKEAKVVWVEPAVQDAITSVTYDSANKMIKFTVSQANVYQGNAVIGLYDNSGNIMWSWHIWFTNAYDKTLYPDLKANNTYTFAPDALGFIYGGRRNIFGSRSVMLRIQQVDDSGNIISGSSTAKVFVTHGSGWEDCRFVGAPYYEWGRKDPFLCHLNVALTDGKSVYSPSASGVLDYKFTEPSSFGYVANPNSGTWSNAVGNKITIGESIQHPNWFKPHSSASALPNRGSWMKVLCVQAWNGGNTSYANNNNGAVTKTIYDPCPAGYHVPNSGVWANALNRNKSYWVEQINEEGTRLYWYAVAPFNSGSGQLIYYPFGAISWPDGYYGTRGTTNSPNGTNPYVRIWTAGPTNNEAGVNLRAQVQGSFDYPSGDYTGVAGQIIPVAD